MESNFEFVLDNSQLMEPDFWDEKAFAKKWEPIFRYASKQGRLYFRKTDDGPIWYLSVTNAMKKVLPTSKYLIDWMIEYGQEGAMQLSEAAAEYGTMMHIFNAKFMIEGRYDFSYIEHDVQQYIADHPPKFAELHNKVDRLLKDMLAFAKFCAEYEVKPMAIEPIVYSDEYRLAGAVDIICEMNARKYTEKTAGSKRQRIAAIVDEKSGGIWETYGLQMELYRRMWNGLHPEYPVMAIFNWAPNDWKKAPSYKLKQWDIENDKFISCTDEYISIIRKQIDPKPRSEMKVEATISLGEDPDKYITYIKYGEGAESEEEV